MKRKWYVSSDHFIIFSNNMV